MFRPLPRKQPRQLPIRRDVINRGAEGFSQQLVVDPPLSLHRLPFGWLLRLTGWALGVKLVITTSAITGRSGTTPGGGSVMDVTFDGTALGTTGEPRPVLNVSARAVAGGKYGFTFRVIGYEFAGPFEC